MVLGQRTLQCLREMINERTEYRSGPQLVRFFNALGCQDSYDQGLPSRWVYTDDRLAKLNGTPRLDQCIREVFSPANFVGRLNELDELVIEFNQYLAFDKWRLERDGAELRFKKLDKIEIQEPPAPRREEDAFLSREFNNVTFGGLGLEPSVVGVLEQRLNEIERCYTSGSPLAVILLAGSTLEGVLLGLATSYPMAFNTSSVAPKRADGKVKRFQDRSLSSFIDVARDLRLVEHDSHKFSHSLRDFRNYIHPFEFPTRSLRCGMLMSNMTVWGAKVSLFGLKLDLVTKPMSPQLMQFAERPDHSFKPTPLRGRLNSGVSCQ